jgi:hypothetical protein
MWNAVAGVKPLVSVHRAGGGIRRYGSNWRKLGSPASASCWVEQTLAESSRAATPSDTTPVVLADAGVENVNAQVDALIHTGVLRRLLAFTELKFSNSMPLPHERRELGWESAECLEIAVVFGKELFRDCSVRSLTTAPL